MAAGGKGIAVAIDGLFTRRKNFRFWISDLRLKTQKIELSIGNRKSQIENYFFSLIRNHPQNLAEIAIAN
jgi:hypothetical protein